MNVLVACEESQRVCTAFREKGHNAFSCDILPCSGGHPEWHIQGSVTKVLNPHQVSSKFYGVVFETADGQAHAIEGKWDLIIAHPPCTYLTVTGNRWFDVVKYGYDAQKRWDERCVAICFFLAFAYADCERIAIENPIGCMSRLYRKPDQIIQPYQFGDPFEKKTCLWLKSLQPLMPTNVVEPPPRKKFDSGTTMPQWYADLWHLPKEERAKERSKTFPGIARAMAEQWG